LESIVRRFARARQGNAGVEFALLLPFLMLLLFGGIEIGRGLHDFHVVNETVRDAARYLSRVPVNCPAAGTGAGLLVNGPVYTAAQHEQRAKALTITGSVDTATPAPGLLSGWDYPADASSVTIRIDCIDNNAGAFQGIYANSKWNGFLPHVVLTADVPFTFLFGQLVSSNGSINITLSHNVVSVGL
jgi:Flp pilus assembly pilin Flp